MFGGILKNRIVDSVMNTVAWAENVMDAALQSETIQRSAKPVRDSGFFLAHKVFFTSVEI
jgi:hypothetical protein